MLSSIEKLQEERVELFEELKKIYDEIRLIDKQIEISTAFAFEPNCLLFVEKHITEYVTDKLVFNCLKDYFDRIYDNNWITWDIYREGPEPPKLDRSLRIFSLGLFIYNYKTEAEYFTDLHTFRTVLIHCMTFRNGFPLMTDFAAHELRELLVEPKSFELIKNTRVSILETLKGSGDAYWNWKVFLTEYKENKKIFIKACPYLPYKQELKMFTVV